MVRTVRLINEHTTGSLPALGNEDGYEMNDSLLEYTIDTDAGITMYTFFIVAGSNTYECNLLVPQEGAEAVPTLILVTSDYFWYLIQE